MNTPTLPAESQLVRVTEVARHLSLSRSVIYQMMDRGVLPYVKLGKSRRVRWSDVQTLVDQNTVARS